MMRKIASDCNPDTLRARAVCVSAKLVFGKPSGDVVIDDLACDPLLGDLQKQLGFYMPLKPAGAPKCATITSSLGRNEGGFKVGMVLGSLLGAVAMLAILKARR